MLIGDILTDARSLMTDLAQVMGPPTLTSLTATAGGTIPNGTYYVVLTMTNQWGETLASAELPVTLSGGNGSIQVAWSSGLTTPVSVRAYIGSASGAESCWMSPVGTATPFTITSVPASVGSPPTRSTAFLPDTDGAAVGAFRIYSWLNEALEWAAAKNRGGIPSFSAVGTTSGQPLYTLNGYWKKLDSAWYDGYPLYLARKNDVFRKFKVTGYVGAFLVHEAVERLIAECWPQPSRTSCQTTLAGGITATGTSATVVNAGGWVLGFGKALIGTEIVEYASLSGNTLQGLTRGLGGTFAQTHLAGEAVTELNLEVAGMRTVVNYSVGSSASTLQAPPGWKGVLSKYIMYLFRSAEQDDKGAQRYLAEAGALLADLSANRIIAGPRQIQANAGRGAETMAGLGSPFGGVIVP